MVTKLPTFRIACGGDPAARQKMLEQTYARPILASAQYRDWLEVCVRHGPPSEEFNGLADVESKMIKEHIERLVTENQHLQVHSASVKSCRSLTEPIS